MEIVLEVCFGVFLPLPPLASTVSRLRAARGGSEESGARAYLLHWK